MKLRYILPCAAAAWLCSQTAADLSVTALTPAVNTDPQSLATAGSVNATIRNNGSGSTAGAFQVAAFEDRNLNGRYDAGTDAQLGTANVAAALAAGASTNVTITLAGVLQFRGSPISVVADVNNTVLESNENNNVRHTGQNSVFTGPADTALNPVVKWTADVFAGLPASVATLSVPAVGDMNADGIPDVVFATSVGTGDRALRVVSGQTGAELFSVTDPTLTPFQTASVALADIDNDNRPEMILSVSGFLTVLEHDGALKWRAAQTTGYTAPQILVADLDRDGVAEIVAGNQVYNSATGARRWAGTGGAGRYFAGFTASAVADLDLDGIPEIVAGPTAYRADGTIYWNTLNTPASLADGPVAIGNFDADPNPEIVVRPDGSAFLYMLEHDGTVKWGVPNGTRTYGGAPSIGDVDGDGQPEIAVVDLDNLRVFEGDGTLKWTIPIFEHTSGITGSTIFDLNNDGAAEVIYADQQKLYILRGSTGAILFEHPHLSSTAGEATVVADVDADGHADILVAADISGSPNGRGVRMFSGGNNNWANTRRLWNQPAFTVTNVNDNLSIPTNVQANWLTPGLNNYRANGFVPESIQQRNSAPDVTVSLLRKLDAAFPASATLVARVGNGGSVPAAVVRVEFRNGVGGTLLGAVNTSRVLNPGEYEDLQVIWTNPASGQINLAVTADTNNVILEGDETNNFHAAQLVIGQGPYVTVDDLLPRGKEGGADLKWTPIPGAVSHNIYRREGSGPQALHRAAFVTSSGAFSDTGLTNNTTYHYEVRWLNAQGVESQPGTEASATPIPRTQRGDTPPAILSAPPTRGRTLVAYRYTPTVSDPDAGDTKTFAISGQPAGMTLNPATGQIDFLPGASQGGSSRIRLTVTDSRGRQAVQIFTLFIETQIVNTPPIFISSALTSGAVGRPYSYLARGADPDAGDTQTYLLDGGPAGMTVNSATGLVQWTPSATGNFPVVLRVRDLAGAAATQSFSIQVQNQNRGPRITSTPATAGTANSTYSYAATATDPDAGDTLTWRLVSGPAGMTLNANSGVTLWTPAPSQAGSHPVTIEVRDVIGAIEQQSWTIAVANSSLSSNAAPIITSEAILSGRVNTPYAYDVNAYDPENQTITYLMPTFPSGATINSSTGLISWTPGPAQTGPFDFVVQARDAQGAVGIQVFTVVVVVSPPATFELISPAAGSDITRPATVVATISDPNVGGPLITWTVKLRKPGMTDRLLNSSSGPITNAAIATIDPTILANDTYTLRVDIFKGAESIFREIPYTISGSLKMGQFTFSVSDLTIPLAGVPLNIARVYDSLDTRGGDFGAGWRLAAFGSVVDAPAESPLQGMRPGDKVYVTRPDGRRVSFRFDPVASNFLFPYVVIPRFSPDAGVFDKLEVHEPNVYVFNGVAYADFTSVWNPSRYILTTKEGVRYEINETAGAESIRDRNGNTITFSAGAISSSTGVSVTLTRDGQGRITRIQEPGGMSLNYAYDAAGNLITAENQLNQITRYFYESAAFPNYLTRIQDPLGQVPVRNVYDTAGRLTATCPPAGDINTLAGCVQISHNPGAQTQTMFNGRGFRRDYTYDARGNLIVERRFIDATNFRDTTRTFNANDNMLTERDPAGNTITATYDSAGNLLSRIDTGGRTTTYTYNSSCNAVATETDPAGGVATYSYDSLCRLRFYRDRANQTTEYRYDAQGNATHLIDPVGATTQLTYTPQGYPATIRDPRGATTTLSWSSTGDLLFRIDRRGRRVDYTTNGSHQITRQTWSDGRIINYTYDATGAVLTASDPSASIAFTYDALGRRTRAESAYPAQATFSVDYTYDANGNSTSAIDSLGGNTQSAYDGLDQLASITQSGAGIANKRVQYAYDSAGLPTSVRRFSDLAGVTGVANTAIEYDCGGCASRVSALRHTNATGTTALNILTFGRNALGDVTQMTDVEGLHSFTYDAARRLTGAVHPNPGVQPLETYTYDAAGNRLTSHLSATYQYGYQSGAGGNLLQSDAQFDYAYDAEGNLTQRRNRSDSSTLNYEYDFRNRVTAIVSRDGAGLETGRNTFAYDPLNRRISSTLAAGETRFYYDDLHPILSIAPGNVVTRRLYGPKLDAVLAEETGLQTRWPLTDQVGTLRTITGNTGAVLTQLTLDTFGRTLANSNPSVTSQLSFAGRESEPVSGNLHFRHRMYDPRTGRFLQADPLEPFSYGYAEGSPLVFTDPLGLTAAAEYEKVVGYFEKLARAEACVAGVVIAFTLADPRLHAALGIGVSPGMFGFSQFQLDLAKAACEKK